MRERKITRLKGYDYSHPGAYFVTVCVHNRECLFGEITGNDIRLNEYGMIAKDEWIKSPDIRKEIKLDEYIVMPNHIHGIVWIDSVGANGRSPLHRTNMGSKTLSSFMAGYKSTVTKQINGLRRLPGIPVWQRNYYEHIIRNDAELNRIRQYIIENPLKWNMDSENPNNIIKGDYKNAKKKNSRGERPFAPTQAFCALCRDVKSKPEIWR